MMGIVAVRRVSTRILSLFVKNRRMSSFGSSKVSPSPSPCLVLKPTPTSYKFYSLEKQRNISKEDGRECPESDVEVWADETVKVVGSCYGWVALLNASNNDLYLLDPIHRKRVNLPNISTLPDPDTNLIGGRGSVSKLILSCSPYDYERERAACSVLITYGVGDRLAWCSLSSNRHWVPVGDLSPDSSYGTSSFLNHMKLYYDIVYCSRRKLFACLAFPFRIRFESLDEYLGLRQEAGQRQRCKLEFLQDTPLGWSPYYNLKLPLSFPDVDDDYPLPSWIDEISGKVDWPIQTSHLVYAEESDSLYLLVQLFEGSAHVPLYNSDLSERTRDLNNDAHLIFKHSKQQRQHYKTAAFVALKFYKCEGSDEMTLVDNLEGLAMFVGANQSFAISPSKFPELNLKPNSVYFTDINGYRINHTYNGDQHEGGVDAGIFDYKNNVILPLQLAHEPFWFTPNN